MASVNTYRDFSFAANEDYPLISNIDFVLEPQVGRDLFNVNPMENDIGDMMKMGLMQECLGEEIIHHEDRKSYQAPFVNSSATVGNVYGVATVLNGDPAAFVGLDYIQLATTSHSPSDGDLAGTKSYPRAGQVICFKNQAFWRIEGKRSTSANAHRLYIKKMKSTYAALSATITLSGSTYGGDQFTVPSNAFEEATWGMSEGLVPATKTYKSYFSTFGDLYVTTDKQEMNKTYPLYDHASGKLINFWHEKGAFKTEQNFMMQEAMGCFIMPKADAGATAYDPISGTSKAYNTSEGYLPTLEANAPRVLYDDTPTLAMFKQINRKRNSLHQGKRAQMWYGMEFGHRVVDLIASLRSNKIIPDGNSTDRNKVELGIESIEIASYYYDLKNIRILDHPDFTNISGLPYPYYFIVKTTDQTLDPKTGIMLDAFKILYKRQAGGGARGHYKVWQTGGNAPVPTNRQRIREINFGSEKGIQVVGADHHILGLSSSY